MWSCCSLSIAFFLMWCFVLFCFVLVGAFSNIFENYSFSNIEKSVENILQTTGKHKFLVHCNLLVLPSVCLNISQPPKHSRRCSFKLIKEILPFA